jgi:pyruvate, water dikinase
MESVNFETLPDIIPMDWVTQGIGLDPTYHLIQNYDKMIDLCYKTWMYHFEFLNLGYAAYLDFFGFCKETFPGIPDLSIAKMVQGVEIDLFRPDEELQKLARLAVKLGVTETILNNDINAAIAALKGSEWEIAWETAKYPWFNFTVGNGFYSTDKYWIEHLDIPFGYVQDYIKRLQKGQTIERPSCCHRGWPCRSASGSITQRRRL